MSKSVPPEKLLPLPSDLGESAEADVYNLLFYSRLRRMLTVECLKKNEAKEAFGVTLNWFISVLGDMPPKLARDYMRQFERIAAESICYDLDAE